MPQTKLCLLFVSALREGTDKEKETRFHHTHWVTIRQWQDVGSTKSHWTTLSFRLI